MGTCITYMIFSPFLAWAIIVHKCQCITVKEIVDMCPLKGQFQCGQAFVALSWVITLENLYILNYIKDQIKISPDVE